MTSHPLRALAIAAALALGTLTTGCATPQKPAVEVAEASQISGRVVSVHRAHRTVALRGPQGHVLTVKVDPAVQNFDQIRVGDEVRLTYLESVAIYVSSDGKPPSADSALDVAVAAKGARPAGEVVAVTDVSATIEAINPVRRVLTLRGPQGNLFPVTVDKSVEGFGALKVGDNVHVRHTEAVALTVGKP